MIFTSLIIIVFIAELIIFLTIFTKLYNLNKNIIIINDAIINSKADIKEIFSLTKNVSQQFLKLTNNYINTLKEQSEINFINKINKILLTFILWKMNIKVIKKIKKNKTFKLLSKGFMLIQNMI